MIETKTDFEKITDFGNLYQAYKKSKSSKGFSKSSQKFQVVALDGIHQIKRRLEIKTYEVGKYNEFTVYEPKERIVKAGSFVDKLCNIVFAIMYSCRAYKMNLFKIILLDK